MGVFFSHDNMLYRVIAELGPDRVFEVRRVLNKFYRVDRFISSNREVFFMPSGINSFVYRLGKKEPIRICLDIRPSYEPAAMGRFYGLSEVDDKLLIEYTKNNPKSGEAQYRLYVAFKPEHLDYDRVERWVGAHYQLDRERNSPPVELGVYDLLRLNTKKIAVSFSLAKNEALDEVDYVYENLRGLESKDRREVESSVCGDFFKSKDKKTKDVFFAYNACRLSLKQLTVDGRVHAGLPWFFQVWSRDELVSLKSVSWPVKKKILFDYLGLIAEDGRLPNLPGVVSATNADSIGWLFLRFDECFNKLLMKERDVVLEAFIKSVCRMNENYMTDEFLMNRSKETWMDSVYADDGRLGCRLEIQAFLLRMYALGYRLTRLKKFDKSSNVFFYLRDEFVRRIRRCFYRDGLLLDGVGDATIRPNVFIAAYVYPGILSRGLWARCFRNVLARLWLDWGGLSSIDKKSGLFLDEHTGENPASYHRGDSWFYLNNLAALVLHRTDAKGFGSYVDAIVEASTDDILWDGMLGHHSELSPAGVRKSAGCGMQAWSSAMYLELIDELFG